MKKVITTIAASFVLLSIAFTKPNISTSARLYSSQDSTDEYQPRDSIEETFFHRKRTEYLDEYGNVGMITITITEKERQEGIQRLKEFRCR